MTLLSSGTRGRVVYHGPLPSISLVYTPTRSLALPAVIDWEHMTYMISVEAVFAPKR